MSFFSRRRARFTAPGDHRVVLQLPGRQNVLVVRELRRTTGCSLQEAVRLVQQPPVVIAERLSETSAAAVVARLTAAGARAVAAPMDDAS